MSQYTYKPLPDSKTFIRLVTITSVDDTVSCSLDDFPIDDPPPFHAVSYCWGTDPASEKIFVDSEWIALTDHLLEGIRCLHKLASPPKLWIDALCINQVDHVEKEGQIPLMRKIYAGAERVLVWLGRGTEGSDIAMNSIPSLCEKLALISRYEMDNAHLEAAGIPQRCDQFWEGFAHIFGSSWFTRVWPLQEVVLAKEVDFFSGVSATSMARLYNIANRLDMDFYAYSFSMVSFARGISGLIDLDTMRIEFSGGHDSNFVLIECSRDRHATVPVDYVYALLGILDVRISSRIPIDYSEQNQNEYWRTFANLATELLMEDPYTLLRMVETEERDPTLPSWCPNWVSRKMSQDFHPDFRTGWGELALACKPVVSDNRRVFGCGGFTFDRIRSCVSFTGDVWHGGLLETTELCESLFQAQAEGNPKSNLLLLARTLAANENVVVRQTGVSQYNGDLVKDYALFKQTLREHGAAIEEGGPGAYSLYQHGKAFQDYYAMMYWACKSRCFFITKKGYIGLGPADLQIGDEVCVLLGLKTPYVIRQRPDEEYYQFIGQAYVDGIMYGESMATRDPAHDREFLFN